MKNPNCFSLLPKRFKTFEPKANNSVVGSSTFTQNWIWKTSAKGFEIVQLWFIPNCLVRGDELEFSKFPNAFELLFYLCVWGLIRCYKNDKFSSSPDLLSIRWPLSSILSFQNSTAKDDHLVVYIHCLSLPPQVTTEFTEIRLSAMLIANQFSLRFVVGFHCCSSMQYCLEVCRSLTNSVRNLIIFQHSWVTSQIQFGRIWLVSIWLRREWFIIIDCFLVYWVTSLGEPNSF